MKVTLEKGETLDVALVEGDRIVGTLSLVLRGVSVGAAPRTRAEAPAEMAAPAARSNRGARAAAGGRRKRNVSAEARAKMAEAQRRRWEKARQTKGK